MSDRREGGSFVAKKEAVKNEKFNNAVLNKFGTEAACSRALGWPRQRLNKITMGKMLPDVNDVNALADVLEMTVGEICAFFITEKSPNEQQIA